MFQNYYSPSWLAALCAGKHSTAQNTLLGLVFNYANKLATANNSESIGSHVLLPKWCIYYWNIWPGMIADTRYLTIYRKT